MHWLDRLKALLHPLDTTHVIVVISASSFVYFLLLMMMMIVVVVDDIVKGRDTLHMKKHLNN